MATCTLVSIPAIDENGCLLAAVTVDDVFDLVPPDGWREQDGPSPLRGRPT